MMNYQVSQTEAFLIEDCVDDLLQQYTDKTGKAITLPIPLYSIAEELFALKCDAEIFKGHLSRCSALILPNKRWIILNAERDRTRLRFSLAHELAHWLIDSRRNISLSREKIDIAQLRSSNYKFREMLANYFAGALVIPRKILLLKINCNSHLSLDELANFFDVSLQALKVRIELVKKYDVKLSQLENGRLFFVEKEVIAYSSKAIYTFIKPPQLIIDYRFTRTLLKAVQANQKIFIDVDNENVHMVESLLEFRSIQGIVLSDTPTLCHTLQDADVIDSLDLRYFDEYYQKILACNQSKQLGQLRDVVFARDDESSGLDTELKASTLSSRIQPRIKLHNRQDAREYINKQKKLGKTVVIVTGCFDLLTNAHVRFFQLARQAGDVLVVGIESDTRVRAFKGPSRPVNTESQRIEVLNELRCVDFTFVIHGSVNQEVVPFYTRLHVFLKANILAVTQGDPYLRERQSEIERAGGQLIIIEKYKDISSTSVLRKLLAEKEFSGLVQTKSENLYVKKTKYEPQHNQLALPFGAVESANLSTHP